MALSFIVPTAIHDPISWATVVAKELISAGPDVPLDRLLRINAFSEAIARDLEPYFVRPDPVNASAALDAVRALFDRTEWAPLFPSKRDGVLRILQLQLAEAAKVIN